MRPPVSVAFVEEEADRLRSFERRWGLTTTCGGRRRKGKKRQAVRVRSGSDPDQAGLRLQADMALARSNLRPW